MSIKPDPIPAKIEAIVLTSLFSSGVIVSDSSPPAFKNLLQLS